MEIGNSMIVEFDNLSKGKDAEHDLLVVPQAGQENNNGNSGYGSLVKSRCELVSMSVWKTVSLFQDINTSVHRHIWHLKQ